MSPPYVNQAYVLMFYQSQICYTQLLSRGCWGNLGIRHHKVSSRDFEDNANRLTLPSSRASFLNLSRWLADARALGSPNLVVVLVGNKSDREDDREVEWAEASKWAAENGVPLLNFIDSCHQKLIVLAQMYISWNLPRYRVTTSRLRFCCVLGRFS